MKLCGGGDGVRAGLSSDDGDVGAGLGGDDGMSAGLCHGGGVSAGLGGGDDGVGEGLSGGGGGVSACLRGRAGRADTLTVTLETAEGSQLAA